MNGNGSARERRRQRHHRSHTRSTFIGFIRSFVRSFCRHFFFSSSALVCICIVVDVSVRTIWIVEREERDKAYRTVVQWVLIGPQADSVYGILPNSMADRIIVHWTRSRCSRALANMCVSEWHLCVFVRRVNETLFLRRIIWKCRLQCYLEALEMPFSELSASKGARGGDVIRRRHVPKDLEQ